MAHQTLAVYTISGYNPHQVTDQNVGNHQVGPPNQLGHARAERLWVFRCFSAISAAKWVSAKPWEPIRFRSIFCVSWDARYSKLGLYKALLRQGIGNAQLGPSFRVEYT